MLLIFTHLIKFDLFGSKNPQEKKDIHFQHHIFVPDFCSFKILIHRYFKFIPKPSFSSYVSKAVVFELTN